MLQAGSADFKAECCRCYLASVWLEQGFVPIWTAFFVCPRIPSALPGALFRSAGMPVGIGEMCAAIPVTALFAMPLRRTVARVMHFRRAMAAPVSGGIIRLGGNNVIRREASTQMVGDANRRPQTRYFQHDDRSTGPLQNRLEA